MTPEQEKQYREEFDNEWATMDSFSPTRDYGNSKIDFARVVYIEARKKSQKEIDGLKEQIASAKEIKQYPTALTYISELKEELKLERNFSAKFKTQISKGIPTPREWADLVLEYIKVNIQKE